MICQYTYEYQLECTHFSYIFNRIYFGESLLGFNKMREASEQEEEATTPFLSTQSPSSSSSCLNHRRSTVKPTRAFSIISCCHLSWNFPPLCWWLPRRRRRRRGNTQSTPSRLFFHFVVSTLPSFLPRWNLLFVDGQFRAMLDSGPSACQLQGISVTS